MAQRISYLPVLSHFENGNFWTGSAGRLCYRLEPSERPDEDHPPERVTGQVWEGPWRQADSVQLESRVFPLSEAGLEAVTVWLEGWAAEVNARPAPSLAESLAARAAVRAARQAPAE